MSDARFERRLAAILAADMVGYSRLMELDETGTIARQRLHRAELIDPAIAENRGRIVKLMGDGMLVEFASVVEAVVCAVQIQRAMADREADLPEDRRIAYRIGINLGDIVVDGDDILGDGVNLAARLESLAEPGGVMVSGAVYDQLKAKVDIGYEFLGEQTVKNITGPVRVYRALLDDPGVVHTKGTRSRREKRRSVRLAAAAAIVLAVLAGGAAWWFASRPDFMPVAAADLALPLPGKPSIAVLPFANASGDASRDFVADGIAETILDTIARSPEVFVIANDATRSYKNKAPAPREIAREQGVQYVLRGTVQEADGRIRVTAQLIDALGGYLLWSERYDRAFDDLFALQDEIALKIAQSLDVHVLASGGQYGFKSVEAWSYYVRARAAKRGYSSENIAEALRLSEAGIAIEPEASPLWVQAGWSHLDQHLRRASDDPERSLELASEAAQEAVRLDPGSAQAQILAARLHGLRRDHAAAFSAADEALRLAPNDVTALGGAVNVYFLGGRHQDVVDIEARIMRLNPFYPAWHQMFNARSLVFLGRHDDALAAIREGLERAEGYHARSAQFISRAFAYADQGELEKARSAMAEARREKPFVSAALFRPYWVFNNPSDDARFYGGLRAAGLPGFAPADVGKMAYALPDHPSIAVMPFAYLGPDVEENGYLAEGLSENVVGALGRIPAILLIDPRTTKRLAREKLAPAAVAERLGVQYVLEGSVQRSGGKVRVTAKLADAVSGQHVWSETYNRPLADVFAMQDAIAKEIAVAMDVELTRGDAAAADAATTNSLDAWKLYLQGRREYVKFKAGTNAKAIELFKQAEERDPDFAAAVTARAVAVGVGGRFHYVRDREGAMREAASLADRAVTMAPRYAKGLVVQAWIDLWRGEHERAVERAERAATLEPNNYEVLRVLSTVYLYSGRPADFLRLSKRSERIQARPDHARDYHRIVGLVDAGHFEAAVEHIDAYEKRYRTTRITTRLSRAIALGEMGRMEEARRVIADLRSDRKERTIRSYFDLTTHPYKNDWAYNRYAPLLEQLGLPAEIKPSIAVLPFQNLSGEKSEDWFADGIAEDIITDLSKLSSLFVIARNSSFQYRGGGHDLRKVGQELGVAYLLEGSVRRAGDVVRINAQLIDARTGGHLWAERFDGPAAQVFTLQDSVTGRIVESLALALSPEDHAAITARQTEFPEAHDAYLKARAHMHERTKEDFAEAKRWLDKALQIDPKYGLALGARALLYVQAGGKGWYKAVGVRGRRDAIRAAHAALKEPTALAHLVEARWLLRRPNTVGAAKAIERALALDPNDPDVVGVARWVASAQGRHDRAIALAKRRMRLDPIGDPGNGLWGLGLAYLNAGDAERALEYLERAQALQPDDWTKAVSLAEALTEVGRRKEAADALKLAAENWPDSWGPFIASTVAWFWYRAYDEDIRKAKEQLLIKAGVPERPEWLDLRPEDRLDKQAMLARLKGGYRLIGKLGANEWMHEQYENGDTVRYWNKRKTGRWKMQVLEDGSYLTVASDRLELNSFCEVYRNPNGSNETFDAFVGLCATGIFTNGQFPLKE